jgi:hypothetical protein
LTSGKEKWPRGAFGKLLVLFSLVPLAFLFYTLLNFKSLGITITHPRVIVEASLFVILLVAGLFLSHKLAE